MFRVFMRKYLILIPVWLLVYTLVFWAVYIDSEGAVRDSFFTYFFYSLLCDLLLIRLFDDFLDYKHDFFNGVAVTNRKNLLILTIAVATVGLIFCLGDMFFYNLSFYVLLLLTMTNFFQRRFNLTILRTFLSPTLVFITLMSFDVPLGLFSVSLIFLSFVITLICDIVKESKPKIC